VRDVQPLLNVEQTAKLLGISVNTLRQWISQRRLPVVKLGKAVRFASEDVEKFIAEHKREAVRF
jgi:excisionase family DNA binding protein